LDEVEPIMIVRPPDVEDISYQHGDLSTEALKLNAQSLHQIFRPFTFKLDALADVVQLAPYLPNPPSNGKKRREWRTIMVKPRHPVISEQAEMARKGMPNSSSIPRRKPTRV
jgi:hypothetical protein